MNALVARGIPCIGIHDSIVVQHGFEWSMWRPA